MDSYWGGGDAASAAADSSGHRCECGGAFGVPEADGFSYCPTCGSQSQDVFHAVADEDDLHAAAGEAALYSIRLKRKCSQPDTTNIKLEQTQTDSVSEPEARDFGGAVKCVGKDELVDGIRRRYVEGLQVMLQRQCETLVERFGVSPIIGGFVGTIWLRFVDASGVFDDGWPERVVAESEASFAAALDNPVAKKRRKRIGAQQKSEPHNQYGQRSIYIWFYALRKAIPVYSTLAISYLACHLAREALLPTDIAEWVEEGKLPYLNVFMDVDKYLRLPSDTCPFNARFMFRYYRVVGAWELEATAGSIAHAIGLHLPSVNFYGIASRYLRELSLPMEKILPHACRVYEWSMPPDLWLSANVHRLPTRVCVLAILIVTIRILYNIHGHGSWEKSLPGKSDSSLRTEKEISSSYPESKKRKRDDGANVDYYAKDSMPIKNTPATQGYDIKTTELLRSLEAAHDKIRITRDYSKDLSSYLKYCKEIVFAGRIHSPEEEKLMERLRNISEMQEFQGISKQEDGEKFDMKQEILTDEVCTSSSLDTKELRGGSQDSRHMDDKKIPNGSGFVSKTDYPDRDVAIENMKLNMEENGFQYLSPRSRPRNTGYLHYRRKRADGELNFVAHAEYYILLRTCASLAQVDVRVMHLGILKLERRLEWTDQQIDISLH